MGKRIKMYHANVEAVLGFYQDLCCTLDATRDKFAIAARLFAFLDGRSSPVAPGPRVIIAGAPASGKGTQCEELVKEFGVVHVSTGDELREHVRQGSDLGRLAQGYMEGGGLVPDEVMVGMVLARLGHQDCAERGWLLDGFPRTAKQVPEPSESALALPSLVKVLALPHCHASASPAPRNRCPGGRLSAWRGGMVASCCRLGQQDTSMLLGVGRGSHHGREPALLGPLVLPVAPSDRPPGPTRAIFSRATAAASPLLRGEC
jgi:hypothetical protein